MPEQGSARTIQEYWSHVFPSVIATTNIPLSRALRTQQTLMKLLPNGTRKEDIVLGMTRTVHELAHLSTIAKHIWEQVHASIDMYHLFGKFTCIIFIGGSTSRCTYPDGKRGNRCKHQFFIRMTQWE